MTIFGKKLFQLQKSWRKVNKTQFYPLMWVYLSGFLCFLCGYDFMLELFHSKLHPKQQKIIFDIRSIMDIELDNFCFHFEYFPTNVSTGWIENHAIWCLIKMMNFFYCNWTATRSKKRLQLVYLVTSSINSKFAIQNAFLRQPLQTYLKPFYIVFVASCDNGLTRYIIGKNL